MDKGAEMRKGALTLPPYIKWDDSSLSTISQHYSDWNTKR